MSFDYDLVVIGSSPEGIYAAHKAVSLQARVALVTQGIQPFLASQQLLYHHSLGEIANYFQRINSNPWGIWSETSVMPLASLAEIKSWGNLVQENITAEQSLGNLAVSGVDVIDGRGEFCRLPKQAFLVHNRQLRSRNYLLATGSKYHLPAICYSPDYPSSNCFTPEEFWQQRLADCPQDLAIIGDSPFCLELAQGLARLGKNISLLSSKPRLLATETVAASHLFQAQFAIDRIRIFVNFSFQDLEIEQLDLGKVQGKVKLRSQDQELVTSGVIFANCPQANIEGLNLKAVKVKCFPQGIVVNEKLQTRNRAIYACGNLLGGNSHLARAYHEVDVALKNMFLLPIFKRDYRYIPKAVFTQPQFARIGLSDQAKISKKSAVYTVTKHFKNVLAAQLQGKTTGWGQFLISSKGEILGCTIIGDRSTELISLFGLMMKHKIRLSSNPMRGLLRQEIPYLSPSFSEIINQVQIAFHQQKINDQPKLQRRLKAWFERRR